MPVVSPRNPDNISFFQPQFFSSHQGSREEATHESLPRRQHSKPLRRFLLPKPPRNNTTSPQPASYHKITSPSEPGLFRCAEEGCGHLSFKNKRTLKRHQDNKHSDALYVCRCGYHNGRGREYAHRKHLNENNCSGKEPYRCVCGHATDDVVEHSSHFKGCVTGKRGRPTKENAGQWQTCETWNR
ncbi:hypothetical protein DER44DRAFT_364842 [Fusarium oxysporum]|nr:hypothetical protein DER44DRAFT_364842 [Fusarium oxysporum]